MNTETYSILQSLGYKEGQDSPSADAIRWLNQEGHLRIEPYWRYLGASGGYSWSKSWDVFSDPVEVESSTWEELLDVALERSVKEAFPISDCI